jgi:predicted Zn finger-like uncharacterized protein
MILTCPSCSMRYLIADSAIGAEGRKVRCASCSHEWYQEGAQAETFRQVLEKEEDTVAKPPVEPIPESVKPIPQGSSVPVIHTPKISTEGMLGRMTGYGAAAAICILFIVALVMIRQPVARAWPPSLLLYDLVGAKVTLPGEGLIIDRVKATAAIQPDGQGSLIVRGSVINLKDFDLSVPRILATLWKDDGSALESWIIDLPHETLKAEQSFDFEAEYPGVPAEAKSVNLTFAAFIQKHDTPAAEEKPEAVKEAAHEEPAHEEVKHEAPAPAPAPEAAPAPVVQEPIIHEQSPAVVAPELPDPAASTAPATPVVETPAAEEPAPAAPVAPEHSTH